ncbi:MAG: HEAT repeat domain-containing protein [Pirellulaceae bacterium]
MRSYSCLVLLFLLLLSAWPVAAQDVEEPPASYGGKTVAQWVADLQDLESQGSDDKRRRAAYALGRLGPAARSAVASLIEVVNDPNMEPRWYAVDALGRIGGDEKVAEVLADAIRKPENDVYVRLNAVKSLGRLGDVAGGQTEVLVEQLSGRDAAVRAAAARSLWQVARRPESLAALKSMLTAPSSEEVFQACVVLEQLGDDARPLIGELVAVLGSDNADARRAASKALGGLGDEAAKAVGEAINTPSASVDGAAAAAALGLHVDRVREQVLYRVETPAAAFNAAVRGVLDAVVPPLTKLLALPDEKVRLEAGRALARCGSLAVPALLTALQSDNEAMRTSAADALARLERYLPEDAAPNANLAGLNKFLVRPLTDAMRGESFEVRYGAIRAAAALRLGSEAAEMKPLLTEALEDEDAGIRRYAAQTLASINAAK